MHNFICIAVLLIVVTVLGLLYYKNSREHMSVSPNKLRIEFIGSEWCHFCKVFKPTFESVKKSKPDVTFEYIDNEKLPEDKQHDVPFYPFVRASVNGSELSYQTNDWANKEEFKKFVEDCVAAM